MSDDELLEGFDPAEQARLRIMLECEANPQELERRRRHKPTWEELWEAGWVENPRCHWPFPTEAGLLAELRGEGSGSWTLYDSCACPHSCQAILQAVYEREGGRRHLRRRTRNGCIEWGWKG